MRLVRVAKASPHAKAYNLSTDNNNKNTRRVGNNSQWGDVWGALGQSPQPLEVRGFGGKALSTQKIAFFC